MNTPQPVTPPNTNPGLTTPTVGSAVGSAIGLALTSKLHLDPVSSGAIVVALGSLFTALFHLVGAKLNVPALG